MQTRNSRRRRALSNFCSEPLESRRLLTATPIVSGQTLAGDLKVAGQIDSYTFSAKVGASLEVTMATGSSGGVHPDIILYSPGGTKISEQTTSYITGTARINYRVPANGGGTFTIAAQDDNYNSTRIGTYNIELAVAPATLISNPDKDGGTIVSGQTKLASINRLGNVDIYTFNGAAGASFEVTMGTGSTGSVHPDVTVYGPDGSLISEQTTSYVTGTARINYTIPAAGAGTYTIFAQDDNYQSPQMGAYNLELAVAPAPLTTNPDGDGGTIVSGQTKLASINRLGNVDIYAFTGAVGASFEVTMGTGSTGSVHPDVTVYGPNGAKISEQTTSYVTGTARINYTIPAGGAGTYTIFAQDDNYQSPQIGAYNLELAMAPAPLITNPDGDGGTIANTQTKLGSINRFGNIDIYTFTASVKDSFEVSMGTGATGKVHPDVSLYGPTGTLLSEQTSSYNVGTARIDYTVPTGGSGTYTIFCQDDNYQSPQVGAYSLSLSGSIHPTNPTITITPPADQTAYATVSASIKLGTFSETNAISPYSVDIKWGDGTADTILSLSSPGTIPTTAHVFPKAGTDTVTETITDSKGNKSPAVTFKVVVSPPTATISGRVFNDANGNGIRDVGELGLGLWTVYLDLNNDGKLDSGDVSVKTDINGNWSFSGLAAGTYTVSVVPVAGTAPTKPSSDSLTIKVAAGQTSANNLFGEKSTS